MDIIVEAFKLLNQEDAENKAARRATRKNRDITEVKDKSKIDSILHTIYDQVLCSLTDAGINDVNLDVPFSNSEKYASRYILGDRNFEQDKESGIRDYARITVLKTPTIINTSKFDLLSKKKDFNIDDYSDEEIRDLRNTDAEISDAPQNFDFAKKVADYYGVDYKEYSKFIEIRIPDPFAPVLVDKIVPSRRDRYKHVTDNQSDVELAMAESIADLDESSLVEGKVKDSLKKIATRLGADAATVMRSLIELIPGDTFLYDAAEHIENKAVLKALLSGNETVLNACTKDDIEELKQDIEDYQNHKNTDNDETEELDESVETSMPVTFLDTEAIKNYIENLPEITADRPPQSFSVGYMRELTNQIPSKFRGGRGSEDMPLVRIFKCTEYSNVFTGVDYENVGFVKRMRAETGKERSGERTGFQMGAEKKIGISSTGSEQLQCYPTSSCKIKAKYFISLDDEDLREVSKNEVAEYLTPAAADKLMGRTADSEDVVNSQRPLRLKLSNIYKIGNLGRSVM